MEKALVYAVPSTFFYVGVAGDPRFYGILVQGLHSINAMIASNAALGLARLGDPRAVNELIQAGEQGSAAIESIIRALVYFPDSTSQRAAENLAAPYSQSWVAEDRKMQKKEGLHGLFPW